jgi:hypothetical protein
VDHHLSSTRFHCGPLGIHQIRHSTTRSGNSISASIILITWCPYTRSLPSKIIIKQPNSALRRGCFSLRRPDSVEGRFSSIPSDHGHQVANIDDDAARSIRCRNPFASNISEFEPTSYILRKKSKNIGISTQCADRFLLIRSRNY